jgi:2-polyprenyl-3-methyl-5-hydroxy-6-metoxy-1,4-benzoquinol methylase
MSASVDEVEIKRFAVRAYVWWDLNGPIAILHKQCPQIRIPLITEGLKKVGKVLEG